MNKVKKILTTLVAATLTVSTGLTSMPMFAHNVKAESKAETISSDTNDMSQYKKINGISSQTVLGADFSHYQLQKNAWKKVWKNYKGIEVSNVFEYVRSQGINTISVKVAVNPTKDKEGNESYLSLENAKKTLKEAKKAGLKTNVTLLYSDDITYAGVQKLPDGWDTDSAEKKALEYTKNVIKELKAADAVPTMITIGNEVNYNFLNMSSGDGWEGFVAMSKISKMIREEGIKPAVSVSAPTTDASDIQWIIGKLGNADVDYDYIGVNIYPDTHNDNYVKTLKNTVEEKAAGKQMIISSVKCPWKDSEGKASITTQTKSIYDYLQVTIDEKNAGGLIYDDADFVGAWNSFFDENGQAMSSLAIFAYAQGNQVDVSSYKDPWEYGGDTGLKDQKVTIKKVKGMSESSIRGMDISSYLALKKAGVKYYDYEGNETPLLKVLHDNGINYIRIRIWNDPFNADGKTYGGGGNDVSTGVEIAKEAAQYDMKVLLDFHYSDFWAEPAVQLVPKAWKKDVNNTEKMCSDVYDFTKESIQKFKDAGANIGMVQVGNEITNGLLGIYSNRDKGESFNVIWGDKKKSTEVNKYLKAGIKAVREYTPQALVALHLETPNVWKYKTIMNTWKRDNVDYDVLGSSYYPFWSIAAKANTPKTLKDVQTLAASYGKMFAVFETSWVNSLNDGDGTPNSIGDSTNTGAYEVGPQGQVNELTDLYDTVLSQDNGLGTFYWEGAWIPVKAGWTNWEYNKQIADQYGTGWASKGALGYFPDSKMYYKGKAAWGGTSWDNQALFDINGYPLQSLKFYKDSVSKGKEQIIALKIVDKNGKEVYPTQYVKVEVGKTRKITLPKFSGYYPSNKNYQLTVKGVKEENATQSVVYTRTAAGPAISYNYRVKVTKKNYKLYKNFKWKKSKTKVYKKTYVAKYRYDHKNGNKYLALYTKGGKFVGYINKKAVKRLGSATQPEQGKAYTYGKRVKIKSKKYKLYKNFKWKKSKTKVYKKTYVAKYRYKHENGNKYLALYTKSGKFVGYINTKAAKVVK
ncbi:Arabinogalactan endo-1%2C4-beta-galactosidase precursor [Anaerostipes hadrus]|uniref:Arabinogalactan endo-beta-1,4-galactanase n=6 Tax=Anaerostipes hadrus TaxID=649756 RepID=A0A173TYS9_ANAHA|nr:glycosyl hydrolase 53 family protein [Anaerostipes hadrus]CUN06398.1 Arabinogalactan endo-1%2C4-beta-galactosidase precursor [Anaerostipes hadrus]